MQQQSIIIDLEKTYQDFRKQQVATHIKFEREKQILTTQIQDWKSQYETTKVQLNKPNPISTYQDEHQVERIQGVIAEQDLVQNAKSSLGRQKPQMEGWSQIG